MLFKCQCCGFEQDFLDGEAAFEAGWDAPPHFTGYICCNLCPAVCVVLNAGHKRAHAYWAEHGRPVEFDLHCVTDDQFDNPPDFTKIQTVLEPLLKKLHDALNKNKSRNGR